MYSTTTPDIDKPPSLGEELNGARELKLNVGGVLSIDAGKVIAVQGVSHMSMDGVLELDVDELPLESIAMTLNVGASPGLRRYGLAIISSFVRKIVVFVPS